MLLRVMCDVVTCNFLDPYWCVSLMCLGLSNDRAFNWSRCVQRNGESWCNDNSVCRAGLYDLFSFRM